MAIFTEHCFLKINLMEEQSIVGLAQDYLRGRKSIIDIGCSYGNKMYPFLELDFSKFKGIDNDTRPQEHTFLAFLRYKFRNKNLSKIEFNVHGDNYNLENYSFSDSWLVELFQKEYEEYSTKFNFDFGKQRGNLITFEPTKKYDVVLVWNVLHFISDIEEQTAVNKIIKCLAPDGVCLIAINDLEKVKSTLNIHKYYLKDGFKLTPKKQPISIIERYLYNEERIENLLSNFKLIKELNIASTTSNAYVLKQKLAS